MIEPLKRACTYAITKAQSKSTGYCARYVRSAVDFGFNEEIKAGKKPLAPVKDAKNSGKSYLDFGFEKVFCCPVLPKEAYKPQLGDIAIIHYEPYGHICIKTEKGWISDFIQRDMYAGKIRDKNPPFDIYRYPDAGNN